MNKPKTFSGFTANKKKHKKGPKIIQKAKNENIRKEKNLIK